MRRSLTVALLVSVVLIGGALVSRFERSSAPQSGTLTAVGGATFPTTPVDDYLTAHNIVPGTSSTAGTSTLDTQNLNETDLLGRQLVSDYVSLEANGQATPDQLGALADNYGQTVASLNTAPQITLSDIKTSDESQASYQAYGSAFLAIYAKYTTQMTSELRSSGDISQPGSGLSSFAKTISAAYAKEVSDLKALSVPPSIAASHLKLINNYLTASWAMGAVADLQKNPALALAGIKAESDNTGVEKSTLADIVSALQGHGVAITSQ